MILGNRFRVLLLTGLLFSVIIRLAVALYLGDAVPTARDEHSYSVLASQLANGQGYAFEQAWYPFTPAGAPTAHWSFLYTAFVAGIYSIVDTHPIAVRIVQAVLGGILIPWLVFRLSRRVFPERDEIALVAAACAAGYAFFVLYAAMLMTETFYIAALLWSLERAGALVEASRNGAVGWKMVGQLGIALGLAALFRQAILPWVAVLFVWLFLAMGGLNREKLTRTLGKLAVAGGVMLIFILPFTIRNYRVYGDFLLLNSNTGYAMYSAQHPMHGTDFQAFAAAPLPEELLPADSMTEAEWDRALMRRGIGFVLADPVRYLRLSASRVLDYFEFWPTDTSLIHNVGRMVSFTLLLPFFIAGIAMGTHRAWQQAEGSWQDFLITPTGLLLLFIVFYSLLHIFTWAMPRYRLPVDAVAMPFAALAIYELATWILSRTEAKKLAGQEQLTSHG